MNKEVIASTISEVSGQLIRNWPLYSFVTSNPLAGMEQLHFDDAIKQMRKYVGINGYPSASIFEQALRENQIDKTIVEEQLLENGITLSVEESLARLHALDQKNSSRRTLGDVDRHIIKWLAVFLDQGIAEWNMPNREKGFYSAWRMSARFDTSLPVKTSITSFPETAIDTIEHLLENYQPDELYKIFKYHLLALPGWTGYIRYRMENADDWQEAYPITLVDYLAVRLVLCTQFKEPFLPDHIVDAREPAHEDQIQSAWLKAMEKSYQARLIEQVQSQANEIREKVSRIPDAQFVFCIDTRSERIRRAVEQVGNYETHGYAGFFGIPMDYKDPDKGVSHKACPPIVDSVFEATEMIHPDRITQGEKFSIYGNLKKALNDFRFTLKNNVPASFGYVESSGFFYGTGLLTKTLAPTFLYRIKERIANYVGRPEWFNQMTLSHKKEELLVGEINLSTHDKAEIAKATFDLMGWDYFAPIVVFSGHGSQTSNNPFESSLDCGACAGNKGGHNARLLADIYNEPEVRKLLAVQYDIEVPEDTWFVAAEHNTTTNHIHLFDKNTPAEYQPQIQKLKSNLMAAQHIANKEQFNISSENIKETMHEAHRRAADWAETRPEWGLAGNASFIIGRRELTSDLNLEARSFLHSYDWEKDPDGEKLEAILQGPMVVTQWINNHYYFSSVDNDRFGGGTKTTLNVTGKFGVVQGNGGDLKFGLPLESLQEDDHILHHLPLRLTVLIQAPVSRVESIIYRNMETLGNLVKNEWIYLAVIDPEMENDVTFIANESLKFNVPEMEPAYK